MPFIKISNVTLYYDFFVPDVTSSTSFCPILLDHAILPRRGVTRLVSAYDDGEADAACLYLS